MIESRCARIALAEEKLGLSPAEMARAMGVSWDTYRGWRDGKRNMSAAPIRCLWLLVMHPDTARRLSGKTT